MSNDTKSDEWKPGFIDTYLPTVRITVTLTPWDWEFSFDNGDYIAGIELIIGPLALTLFWPCVIEHYLAGEADA